MPTSADPAQRPAQLVLANGLRVRLLPRLASSQSAALIRVHAGSHDAPTHYPGLAHFLEHLLFLGSRDYRAAESLMPFVQGCGGQLNASTRERHTDFFFQLSASHLKGALLRLLDMLAHPLLEPDAQLREREVLDAEFQARAQDAETLCDAALGFAIDAAHPFSGFHAGNRDTLPVAESAFQLALTGYHHRFYHAAQIELLLAGPQSDDQLMQLAELADATLASGGSISRQALPLRRKGSQWLRLQLADAQPRLLLAFVLDGLPDRLPPALDFLGLWLGSQASGGLAQRLSSAELCRSVKLRVPYQHEGQGVAVIELLLTPQGLRERATLIGAVLDWLGFFSKDAHWASCFDDYQRIRRRSLQRAEPLGRLQHWVEPLAWSADGDEAAIRLAFVALMSRMLGTAPFVLTADDAACDLVDTGGFPLRVRSEAPQQSQPFDWDWYQPARNRWLDLDVVRYEACSFPAALRWSGPPDRSGQGALYLSFRFTERQPSASLWHALSRAIQPGRWEAQQAGVLIQFEDLGDRWVLRLEGYADVIPAILLETIAIFAGLPAQAILEGRRLAAEQLSLHGDQMLLRQMLERLPRLLALGTVGAKTSVREDGAELARIWRSAQWQALAVGFADDLSGPLVDALERVPGAPARSAITAPSFNGQKRWHVLDDQKHSPETAFLLFCPLPNRTPECEAAWRVLAVMIEGPFFRRLRSELQLGYAVFSRFSQFGSGTGIVFGVQSPSASAAQIVEHIDTFLSNMAETLAEQPAEAVERTAREAGERHVADHDDLRARAAQAWQSVMSGHEIDHPVRVAAAMRILDMQQLSAALETLRMASGGWMAVTNAPIPNASWS